MKCEKCTKRLEPGWNFCPFCAHAVPASSSGRSRRTNDKHYRGIVKGSSSNYLKTLAEQERAHAAESGEVIKGVGVSDPEGRLDWMKMHSSGVTFAFIRASHGDGGKDYAARQNLNRCRDAGIIPGLYHYFLGYADPGRQAVNFLAVVDQLRVSDIDMPPAVDLKGLRLIRESVREQHHKLHLWLSTVKEATRRRIVIFNGGPDKITCDDCDNWVLDGIQGDISRPYLIGSESQLLDFIKRSLIEPSRLM